MSSQDELRRALAVPPRTDAAVRLAASGSVASTLAIKSALGPSHSAFAAVSGINERNEQLSKLMRPMMFPAAERMRAVSGAMGLAASRSIGRPALVSIIDRNSELFGRLDSVSLVAKSVRLENSALVAKMSRVSEIAAFQSRILEPKFAKFGASLVVSSPPRITRLEVRSRPLSAADVLIEPRRMDRLPDTGPSELLADDHLQIERVVAALAGPLNQLVDEVADMNMSIQLLVEVLRSEGLVTGSDESVTADVALVLGTFGVVNAGMSTSPVQALLSGSISLGAYLAARRADGWFRGRRK